ncbi:Tetratricopeptide repeat-containing protein [Noviherbaspirillum humi]|uniref:Tetratricopeptide repeat-containing protein n=1 Tax=Noviherbaspirillum humi TaxID=1688639 RepID=A0A239F6T4_9BURK|nr:PA2778 family cysteine peptidase [Noviherbaspirillum humi]SNS52178.1 Tetratricopeptide repeat-containing protein [Noviherbaspirillum humi]
MAKPWQALRLALLLLLLALGGCATQTAALREQPLSGLPRRAELAATPFFAQERYQCGPAALAMVLQASGQPVSPEELVPQVYVPQRQGSLAPEMLAAGRRNGAVAVPIAPKLSSLLQEVAAGNPVVILQNLSLPISPLWHYAVVIGYNLDDEELILRSGTTERQVMAMSTFEHTWARGDYWGMVALPPGRLPASVDEAGVAEALVGFEKSAPPQRSRLAYDAALKRWPRNLTLQLGSGNAAYAAGDLPAAIDAFTRASQDHPDSAPAFNNLASALAEAGKLDEARAAAEKAVAIGGPWREAALGTLADIRARQATPTMR